MTGTEPYFVSRAQWCDSTMSTRLSDDNRRLEFDLNPPVESSDLGKVIDLAEWWLIDNEFVAMIFIEDGVVVAELETDISRDKVLDLHLTLTRRVFTTT